MGEVAYRLKLPERLKIHPTFDVSFLKPYFADADDPDKNRSKRVLYQYLHNMMLKLRRSLITEFWAQVRKILRKNSWFIGKARLQLMQFGKRQKTYSSLMLKSRTILK